MILRRSSSAEDKKVTARLARNIGWVFSAQIISGICGLIAMAASARALGAEGIAVVALVEAYMRLSALFVHLEPWQAVIRYGSEALEKGDTKRLRTLIGFSTAVDVTLGVAAALVGFALVGVAAPLLGLENETRLLQLAALSLAVSLRPTGIALLRLFDRFDTLARVDAATAVARALLSVLVAALGGGPAAFVAIVIALSLADGSLAYVMGRRIMADRLSSERGGSPLQALRDNPGLLRVFGTSNASVILRQATQRLDVILLATLVTPEAVGFYHIARRTSQAALKLGSPLSQAIFPELARFAAASDHGRLSKLLFGVSGLFVLLLSVVLIPVLVWIEPLVVLAFTESFRDAALVVALQLTASTVLLAGVAVVPAMISLDKDVHLVVLRLAVTVLFFAVFWPMSTQFGAEGAAATHLICNLIWLGTAAFILRFTLARRPLGAT
jgi:O-antigen/teichoic acid export membrane protein